MTKIEMGKVVCPDLKKALIEAEAYARSNFQVFPTPNLQCVRTPWNHTSATSVASATIKCGGCNGGCLKTATVSITLLESEKVYAETYPEGEETTTKVFNLGGKISITRRVSGHQCASKR